VDLSYEIKALLLERCFNLARLWGWGINFLSTSEDFALVAGKRSLHFPWTLEKRDGQ